ncbi:unnamed protein product [Mytilus coruscus]|uniref:Uncharacterized protein n=1 Tax=Mytilus coruscus TaxID=42192 RepID=A0A6J8C1T9_MYTCO|nr:unnamed protein product [Mytilus coruscus]
MVQISSDTVGNDILKSLKDPTTLIPFLLLVDTIQQISVLSLVFQRRYVKLGMVKITVDKTIMTLVTRQTQDRPCQIKYSKTSSDLQLTTSSSTDFDTKVKEPFPVKLINNIQDRFVDQLSGLHPSGAREDLPAIFGFNEMFSLLFHELNEIACTMTILYFNS